MKTVNLFKNHNLKISYLKIFIIKNLDEEDEINRRELNARKKLGEEGYKKYKDIKHKIFESKNLNSKVFLNLKHYVLFNRKNFFE